jgi:hypothetical protein
MFKQNHIIDFILNDIESIQAGLKKYQDLLKKDLVNLGNEMDVLFAFKEENALKPLQGNHGDLNLLKELGKISMVSYTLKDQTFDDVSSEAIFFSHALLHEDLLEDVVETAKEIVNYARRHNDTWDMWADDMGVFGLDALYILAKKHPEYTYLIAGFMIPYWDDEHADYAFRYLQQLYLDHGFTDDLLKAYCYCDGDHCRMSMLGISYDYAIENYFDLGQYLKDNPDKYKLFKDILLERYREQPFLQYSDSDYTDRPVQKLYGTMMISSNPDLDPFEDEGYWEEMEKRFIDDSYDNESYTLQVVIEEAIGKSLVDPKKDEDEDDEDGPTEHEVWKDFFTNGFENGEALWHFIMTGENEDLLNDLEETDIRRLSKEKDLLFYEEKIEWFLGGYETFSDEFHRIFEGFITGYYEESETGHRVIINGEDISGRQTVIRALDVFYRLMGQQVFVSDFFNLIREYDVMTTDEFVQRYDLNKGVTISTLSSLLSDPIAYQRYTSSEDFDRIYTYIEADRERALTLFTGKSALRIKAGEEEKVLLRGDITKQRDVQMNLLEKGLYMETGLISTVSYLIERDIFKGHNDDLTQVLMNFLEDKWLDMLLDGLREGSRMSEAELGQIKKHLIGNPPPPKELFMKAMMEGKEALTKEELALLNPNASTVSIEEAINLLKDKLKTAKKSRNGIRYKIFNGMSDYCITYLIPALYFGGYRLNLKSSKAMASGLKLLGTLAPQKIMSIIYDMGHKQIKDYSTYDFRQDMKRLKLDPNMVLATEIIKSKDEDYETYVKLYVEADDEPSGGMFRDLSKSEFNQALEYLNAYDREAFYEEVSKLSPGQVDHLSEFIENLKEFAEDNLAEDFYNNDKEKRKVASDLHELLVSYLSDGDQFETITPMLDDYISASEPLRKNLWNLENLQRDRFLKLLIEVGPDGIDAAISNGLIDDAYVEMTDYVEKLVDLGTPIKMLVDWGLDWEIEETFIVASRYEDIYPYIVDRPLGERETALDMVKNSPEMIAFVQKMSQDQSSRIQRKAEEILEIFK